MTVTWDLKWSPVCDLSVSWASSQHSDCLLKVSIQKKKKKKVSILRESTRVWPHYLFSSGLERHVMSAPPYSICQDYHKVILGIKERGIDCQLMESSKVLKDHVGSDNCCRLWGKYNLPVCPLVGGFHLTHSLHTTKPVFAFICS